MLTKLQTLREEREEGFTLIELLVVILIIGILAAIAIPVFLNQRQTANDGAVKSDIRNAAIAAETAIVDNDNAAVLRYNNNRICAVATAATACPTSAPEVKLSTGVVLTMGTGSTPNSYTINGWHENGKVYKTAATALVYNSANGGLTN